jgi:hypothetical protein
MDSTRRHRGSISHHHGIGLVRSGYLKEALGQGFEVLVALKAALDPGGILNPGKLGLPTAYGPPLWEKMATGDSSAGESLGAGSSGSAGDTHPESSEGSQP